jgi:hypothetical protein
LIQAKYKIVVGYSVLALETNVNFFLSTYEGSTFTLEGPPQMFGHNEYIQALVEYKHVN